MINKIAKIPLLLMFLLIFTVSITAIIAMFSVIDKLFLSVPYCEDVHIKENNVCYNENDKTIILDVQNNGTVFIDGLNLRFDNDQLQMTDEKLFQGDNYSYTTSYSELPETLSIVPFLNRRGDCEMQQLTYDQLNAC